MRILWPAIWATCVGLMISVNAAAAEIVKWSHRFPSMPSAPTLYPDASKPTGVVVTTKEGVYLFDGNGRTTWEQHPDAPIATPATAADLDGDGCAEIVFCLESGAMVCLSQDGAVRWRHSLGSPGEGAFKYVTAADVLAESPGLELLIGFDDGCLHCVSAQGKALWDFYADKRRISPVAVGDAGGDGQTKIVFGTDSGNIYCLNGAGQVKWRHTAPAPFGRSGPNLADLDQNGHPVVLVTRSNVGSDPCLVALDGATGRMVWQTSDMLHGYVSNAIADLDGDGRFEVIHADKANWIYCVNADGSERWRKELKGNGIFQAPAVGDLDGDGKMDLAVTVRDTDSSAGVNVFVLGNDGAIRHQLKLAQNANAGPAIGDIDGDGQLELIVATEKPSELRVLSWGGGGCVGWPSIRGDSAMTGLGPKTPAGHPGRFERFSSPEPISVDKPSVQWGDNAWQVAWKTPAPENAYLELCADSKRDSRTVWIADVAPGATSACIEWGWKQHGKARVTARLLANGKNDVLAASTWSARPSPPEECGEPEVARAVASAVAKGKTTGADTTGMELRLARLKLARADLVRARRAGRSGEDIGRSATAVRREARALQKMAQTAFSLWAGGDAGSFICWQDLNPWDRFDPDETPGATITRDPIRIFAFGNEQESMAVNMLNLTADPIEVRCVFQQPILDPAKKADATPEPPLAKQFTLRRAVAVPSDLGVAVNDALPELDRSRTITLAPGVVRQVWIDADTHGLNPGTYSITLYLGSLAQTATIREIPIQLEVSPIALPDGVYAQMNWTTVDIGQTSDQQLRDMLAHNMSVAMGPKLPPVPVDAQGNLAGAVDWAHVDASLARLPTYFQLLISGPPSLQWPKNATVDPKGPAYAKAYATSVNLFAEHMGARGFGNDRWAFYPVDEPWNTGLTRVSVLREFCQRIRAINPKIRLYADPAGMVRVEYLKEFAGLIDVWQPEINLLKRDPKLVSWFQNTGKTVWAYEASDRAKNLLPLGYYRAHAWLAWQFHLQGAGFWVYKYEDNWWPLNGSNWSVVYQTNDEVVPSRRWEACRDGVDDYRLLTVLRDEIARARTAGHAQDADRAQAQLDEAVSKIVGWQAARRIDEITRQTRDYEIDFELFDRYRSLIAKEILRLRALQGNGQGK